MNVSDISFTETIDVINQYGNAILRTYKDKLSKAGYQQGELFKTSTYEITTNNTTIVVTLKLEEYWKYIEYGRKANSKFPPPDVIRNWIEAKQIVPKPYNGKLPTLNQLTYLISRSIAKKGIKARPFLEDSVSEVIKTYTDKIAIAITNDVNNYLNMSYNSTINLKVF